MKLEKATKSAQARRRSYDDACGAAHALDLIGERWALLVIRELMLGPKRFSDLRADLPGISANVLTQRLTELEAAGVLVRRRLPPPAAVQVYELTPWGYEAEPMFQSLGRWGSRSAAHDPTLPFGAVSLMLSFRTMFAPDRAGDFSASIGFRIGREEFLVRVADAKLTVARGDAATADVTLIGPAAAFLPAVYGGQPIDKLTAAGAFAVEGDKAVAERFVTLFTLPPKAVKPGA